MLRTGLALAAIPLAPFLYREHPAVLVLLRPTKEVLLFAGYAAHRGDVSLATAVLAALLVLLGGVWLFYAIGRAHGTERDLPGLLGRLLPSERVQALRKAVERSGEKVLFLGRLAAMPSSLLAAAAGASGVEVRRFLIVDTAGALTSLALMLGLGWVLDDAYESTGPWLTAVGVAAVVAVGVIIGRALSRGSAARPGVPAGASR